MDPDSKRLPPSRLRRFGEHGRSVSGGLRVTVSDGRGGAVRDGGLARWLAGVAPASARGEVAIALVGDARVRDLNRQYRRKNQPTDVLSFPADPEPPRLRAPDSRALRRGLAGARRPSLAATSEGGRFLGDIVIASGVARRQARAAGHPYTAELRVLALHGLLHLLGYDHEDASDRGRMTRLEAWLRRKGKLRTGLIERQTDRTT